MTHARQDTDESTQFYQQHYRNFIIILAIFIVFMLMLMGVVFYQVTHRPLPVFTALAADGQSLELTVHDEPNFLPGTITRWANKAAVAAYTFDFANSNKQLLAVRPYFTDDGWDSYRSSISPLLNSVIQNQVFITSVVTGVPVIVSQGDFDGSGYKWRVQMPFLVTTQSAETTTSKNYTVTLTIVKVPTNINPVGIGIDQFVMA